MRTVNKCNFMCVCCVYVCVWYICVCVVYMCVCVCGVNNAAQTLQANNATNKQLSLKVCNAFASLAAVAADHAHRPPSPTLSQPLAHCLFCLSSASLLSLSFVPLLTLFLPVPHSHSNKNRLKHFTIAFWNCSNIFYFTLYPPFSLLPYSLPLFCCCCCYGEVERRIEKMEMLEKMKRVKDRV